MLQLLDALQRYFIGMPEHFSFVPTPRHENLLAFTRSVWDACRHVPYGTLTTYAALAARLGNPQAARAVGTALKKNPLPIIVPCHRVIRADGSLGGYSQGIRLKQALVQLEGAR